LTRGRLFGGQDRRDVFLAVGKRQALEDAARFRIGGKRLGQVVRQLDGARSIVQFEADLDGFARRDVRRFTNVAPNADVRPTTINGNRRA